MQPSYFVCSSVKMTHFKAYSVFDFEINGMYDDRNFTRISSCSMAQCSVVTDRQTDRQTDRPHDTVSQ